MHKSVFFFLLVISADLSFYNIEIELHFHSVRKFFILCRKSAVFKNFSSKNSLLYSLYTYIYFTVTVYLYKLYNHTAFRQFFKTKLLISFLDFFQKSRLVSLLVEKESFSLSVLIDFSQKSSY